MRMTKKDFSNGLTMGLALFAIYFGAGNLIFPPKLGALAGDHLFLVLLGYLITAVGLPLTTILVVNKHRGDIYHFTGCMRPFVAKFIRFAIIMVLGIFFAHPRVAAVSYETLALTIAPDLKDVMLYKVAYASIFFAVSIILSIKKSKIVDLIGTILTPLILLSIVIMAIKGFANSTNLVPMPTVLQDGFTRGFTEGYQTMDALVSVLLGGFIAEFLNNKGITDHNEQRAAANFSALVAGACLAVVYGVLLTLGSKYSSIIGQDGAMISILVALSKNTLGESLNFVFIACVIFACLTTSIGLMTLSAEYLKDVSKGKISYSLGVILVGVVCTLLAVSGVDKIVVFAVPVLVLIYPIVMVFVLINIISSFVPNRGVWYGAILGATAMGVIDALNAVGVKLTIIYKIVPLAGMGFGWIVPALIFGLIGAFVYKKPKA